MTQIPSLTANRPTAGQLREYGQLRPNNHELWKYLQRRVLEPVSLKVIADELKLDEPALVVWMLTYTGPKRKPYQSRNGDPIGKVRQHMPQAFPTRSEPLSSVRIVIGDEAMIDRSSQAGRYARWRSEKAAARKADGAAK